MARNLQGAQTLFFTYSKNLLTQEAVSSNLSGLEGYLIEEQNKVGLFGGSSEFFRIPLDLVYEDLVAEAEDAGISCIADIALVGDDDEAFDALVNSGFIWDEYCGRHICSKQPTFRLDSGPVFLNIFSLDTKFEDPNADSISCHDLDLDQKRGAIQLVESINVASLKTLQTPSPSMELPNGHYIERAYSYRRPSFGLGHLRLSPQKPLDVTLLRLHTLKEEPNCCFGISYGLIEPEFSLLEEAGGETEGNEFYVLNHNVYQNLEDVIAALESSE